MALDLFRYIGIALVGYVLLRLASIAYEVLFRPSSISRFNRKDRDAWALVTGATDGIGYGFCQELAERGFNVILHGRNGQKLDKVSAALKKEYPGVQTRTFVADASGDVSFEPLLETVKGLHLTVLVNNVGGTGPLPKPIMYLHEQSADDIQRTININAGFATKITSVLIPTLMENEPSLLLFTGSIASLGIPQLSVYAGSKNYLLGHAEALQSEFISLGKDVTVHQVHVARVHSAGNPTKPSLTVPTSRGMARATLGRVGSSSVTITPFIPHAISKFIMTSVPTRIRRRIFIQASKDTAALLAKMR